MKSRKSAVAGCRDNRRAQRRRQWAGGCLLALVFVVLLLCVVASLLIPKELTEMSESAVRFSGTHSGAFSVADNGVRLVSTGPTDATVTLVFLHGSPGDWSANLPYLESRRLIEGHRVIAPDRPGYGLTPVDDGGISMATQAYRLVRALDPVKGRKIWIGHSFGASVAARVAMDHPGAIDALVLVAGAMAPDYERKRWYHRIGNWRVSRSVLPGSIDMANQEAIVFEGEFEEMAGLWKNIRCPVTIIHGREDRLADYRHVAFTTERLPGHPRIVTLDNEGHFIYWTHPEIVTDEVLRIAEELQ